MGAFSPQSLAAQESIIQRCTDAFVTKIGPFSQEDESDVNMVEWLEMNAFDLLGEMAFGESFGCIAEEKHHFWIDLILKRLREIVLADNLCRVRLLAILGKWVLPPLTTKVRAKHQKYSREKPQRRLDSKPSRQVFFTNIVAKVKSGEFGSEERACIALSFHFAFVDMSLVLSKLFSLYDMELMDGEFDWESQSRHWILWWKAPVQISRPACALLVKVR
ncbi:putative Cytochrome P450 monooxygenase [Seiridium unicorne]|uniref:Cytochrome P450 monooxygenase n=1 Tax=Seiridium unicorne TaxID=138068 RepID=A0ABR2VBP1_9PEZI